MRNTSKMTTLENRFPLLAVEHGCIISKDADITVAFEVELPELYTVTGAEYEAIHSCWCKAIKVLPDYSVVHKQDWFIKERYKPELQKDDMVSNFQETVKIYQQGKKYYDALKSVNNLVKDARKVQQTILMVGDITDIYVNSFQRMLRDGNFRPEELSAIAFGYTKLLEESNEVLTELRNVVNITTLSMGGQNGGQPSAEQRAEPTTVQKGKKNKAMPIRQVEHQVVSSLSQPMSNAEFVAALSQERNRGFNTAVGTAEVLDRNTIPACVHGLSLCRDAWCNR